MSWILRVDLRFVELMKVYEEIMRFPVKKSCLSQDDKTKQESVQKKGHPNTNRQNNRLRHSQTEKDTDSETDGQIDR